MPLLVGGGLSRVPEGYVPPPPSSPTSSFGNPGTFTAAANTQASDYDRIMKQYADLLTTVSRNPITATPISPLTVSPTLSPYSQSADVTGSLSNLSNLTSTGGYSGSDIADIRARDISPIRSIYANAQQNVERQRALQGGYSPNFDAVQAQMARDEAQQIADTTTNVNANIAQNVAANKLTAAPSYAGASATANAAKTAADRANAEIVNSINESNANRALSASTTNANNALAAQFGNINQLSGIIGGQTSLYGTTPALTSTFGNQVAQATQLGQNQQQLQQQRQRNILGGAGLG